MMKKKRICASMLAFAMSMTMLAGCKRQAGDAADTGGTSALGQESGIDKTVGADVETAMGRYVEEVIELPAEAGDLRDRQVKLIQRSDGRIFFYTCQLDSEAMGSQVSCYEWIADHWEERESGLNQARLDGLQPSLLSIGQEEDGTEYLTYLDWDSYDETDQSMNVYVLLADPEGEQSYYADGPIRTDGIIDYVHRLSDGGFVISNTGQAIHFDASGQEKGRLLQGMSSTTERNLAAAGGMEYLTLSPESDGLLRYDLNTDAVSETIPMVESESGIALAGTLTLDPQGNIYLCNSSGIHFWKKGGGIWETLVDGSLSSLSMPSLSILSIVLGGSDDILILTTEQDNTLMIRRFFYNPEIPSVPSGTLSIYGLSDSPTIRQAITIFQNQHPDFKVDFQVGDGGDGSTTQTDIIKALNTELVNRKGADILILDGLPLDDYIEKGVLADLGAVVNPMLADNTLMDQAAGFMKQEDQAIYAVPVRFLYPIMYGSEEGLAAMESLRTIKDYSGSLPLVKDMNHMEILKNLMYLYNSEIFNGDGMISKENLVLLLEASKALHDRGVNPDMDALPDVQQRYHYRNSFQATSGLGLGSFGDMYVYAGEAAVALEVLNSVQNIMVPAEIIRQSGVKPMSAGGVFIPSRLVGVNAASSNQELANEFIRLLLSNEIQTVDVYDGFPVNTQAFDSWRTYRNEEVAIGISMVTDEGVTKHLEAVWPDQEQQEELFALFEEMKVPVLNDRVLTEIITDEAKTYFDGAADASQTADTILNRAALYFGE